MTIISPSGGLVYHWRARKFKHLWEPFKQELSQLLCQKKNRPAHLKILGASGGYCLPGTFLNQFEKIEAVDPDLTAPFAFFMNHPEVKVRWQVKRLQFEESRPLDAPIELLLYANLLGQIPLHDRRGPIILQRFKSELEGSLSQNPMISFHDLYSSTLPFPKSLLGRHPGPLAPKDLISYFDRDGGRREITDHLTWNLFENGPRHFLQWQITPEQYHLIEYVERPEN